MPSFDLDTEETAEQPELAAISGESGEMTGRKSDISPKLLSKNSRLGFGDQAFA